MLYFSCTASTYRGQRIRCDFLSFGAHRTSPCGTSCSLERKRDVQDVLPNAELLLHQYSPNHSSDAHLASHMWCEQKLALKYATTLYTTTISEEKIKINVKNGNTRLFPPFENQFNTSIRPGTGRSTENNRKKQTVLGLYWDVSDQSKPIIRVRHPSIVRESILRPYTGMPLVFPHQMLASGLDG